MNHTLLPSVVIFRMRMIGLVAALLVFAGIVAMEQASAAETPEDFHFEDGFETGNLSHANEYFEWSSGANTSVSSDIARTGSHSLKFTFYCCTVDHDAWSEQRFDLSEDIDEIWISWYQYYPDGNELAELGKDLGPRWSHRVSADSNNNKLLRIGIEEPGGIMNPIYGYSSLPVGQGNSEAIMEFRPNGSGIGRHGQSSINGGILVDDRHRGRWVEYIAHFKTSSGWQVADGKSELWVDGLKVHNHHKLNSWPTSGGNADSAKNVFSHGYILGWANSGFDETSFTYIDDFVVSANPPATLGPEDFEPEEPAPPIAAVNECTDDPQAQWIFCDDFEEDRFNQYYDYFTRWGRYERQLSKGIEMSYGMTSYFGHYSADPVTEPHGTWLKKAFGKTPDNSFYKPSGDTNEAIQELYARFFVKTSTDEEGTAPMSTGPLVRLHGIGPGNIPFMQVELRYPDQTGVLQSVLSTGQFDGAGNPAGVTEAAVLNGVSPVMHRSESGDWHEIEIHVKLNTPGQSDGEYELWIDGELESSKYDLDWAGSYEDYGINALEFYNMNNQPGVASGDLENRVIDNVLISRSKIGVVTEEPNPPITGENIALNKLVAVSSSESNSTAGSRVVDGNLSTRWASLGQSAPQWVSVDLGETYVVEHVRLFWEAAYASAYQIQVSDDGVAWTDVYSTTSGVGAIEEISFAPTEARFVRMYGTVRGSPYGFSLYEFEIYGALAEPGVNAGHLDIDDEGKRVGENIELTVSVDQETGSSFTILDVVVHYDPQKLEFETINHEGTATLATAAIESLLPNFGVTSAVKESLGQIRVIMMTGVNHAVSGGSPVFRLIGKVKDDASIGSTVVSLSGFETSLNGGSTAMDVSAAFVSFEIALVDKTSLSAAITNAQQIYNAAAVGSAPGEYPLLAKEVLYSAIGTATDVYHNANATQAEVNNAVLAMNAAVTAFTNSVNVAVPVDFTSLNAAIDTAESKYNRAKEGSKIGQYAAGSKEILLSAIHAAKAVRDHSASTQAQVAQAVTTLQQAEAAFSASIITLVPGASSISIRDLSIIAHYFGVDEQDDNWSEIEIADINGEGRITIDGLAAVAQMILDDWLAE